MTIRLCVRVQVWLWVVVAAAPASASAFCRMFYSTICWVKTDESPPRVRQYAMHTAIRIQLNSLSVYVSLSLSHTVGLRPAEKQTITHSIENSSSSLAAALSAHCTALYSPCSFFVSYNTRTCIFREYRPFQVKMSSAMLVFVLRVQRSFSS